MSFYTDNVSKDIFLKAPVNIDKYLNKEILQYAIGANLYMNGGKDFYTAIVTGKLSDVKCISICFEDATKASEVEIYKEKVIKNLDKLSNYIKSKENKVRIPLIFIRVRNFEQFISFTEALDINQIKMITGFIFPKFSLENGERYLQYLKTLARKFDDTFYAMPILETEEILYKETRLEHLIKIKELFNKYKELILNVRVGGTDFSSKFSLRRNKDFSIYDIKVISDCMVDIINIFGREESKYIVSAPVFEYFSEDFNSKEVKGLIRETKLDKENGFCGKTIIHPSQCKYVNAIYAVLYEEYIDAIKILEFEKDGGVFKGFGDNKMNEVKPHLNWAKKIISLARVYGVLNEGINEEEIYLAYLSEE